MTSITMESHEAALRAMTFILTSYGFDTMAYVVGDPGRPDDCVVMVSMPKEVRSLKEKAIEAFQHEITVAVLAYERGYQDATRTSLTS